MEFKLIVNTSWMKTLNYAAFVYGFGGTYRLFCLVHHANY
jgi:hypothetical protein